MRVTVRVPSMLRADAGGEATIPAELDDAATLGDLLAALAESHPRLERRVRDEQGAVRRYVNLFVGADECRSVGGLAAPLGDGVEVLILPSVAGG